MWWSFWVDSELSAPVKYWAYPSFSSESYTVLFTDGNGLAYSQQSNSASLREEYEDDNPHFEFDGEATQNTRESVLNGSIVDGKKKPVPVNWVISSDGDGYRLVATVPASSQKFGFTLCKITSENIDSEGVTRVLDELFPSETIDNFKFAKKSPLVDGSNMIQCALNAFFVRPLAESFERGMHYVGRELLAGLWHRESLVFRLKNGQVNATTAAGEAMKLSPSVLRSQTVKNLTALRAENKWNDPSLLYTSKPEIQVPFDQYVDELDFGDVGEKDVAEYMTLWQRDIMSVFCPSKKKAKEIESYVLQKPAKKEKGNTEPQLPSITGANVGATGDVMSADDFAKAKRKAEEGKAAAPVKPAAKKAKKKGLF